MAIGDSSEFNIRVVVHWYYEIGVANEDAFTLFHELKQSERNTHIAGFVSGRIGSTIHLAEIESALGESEVIRREESQPSVTYAVTERRCREIICPSPFTGTVLVLVVGGCGFFEYCLQVFTVLLGGRELRRFAEVQHWPVTLANGSATGQELETQKDGVAFQGIESVLHRWLRFGYILHKN
jgi:hypothetical protein